MKDYNGFSSNQRAKAQRWLNSKWSAGHPRPSQCCACGQTAGVIDAHAEDYSEPFAHGKTDEYPLCFACHMMVHCRFGSMGAWDAYRAAIGGGWRPPAYFTRSFPSFQRRVMQAIRDGGTKGLLSAGWSDGHRIPARRPLDAIHVRAARLRA